MSDSRNRPSAGGASSPDNHQEAPPSYAQATGSSTTSHHSSHLNVPGAGTRTTRIPTQDRRSMEDEVRPLPAGWVRQYDTTNNHQFFVDTKATPPRSIWHHPYDDEQYLRSLSSEERERIQDEEAQLKRPLTPASVDLKHDPMDQKRPVNSPKPPPRPSQQQNLQPPSRPSAVSSNSHQSTNTKKKGFGEKFKEKMTGMTAEERAREKEQQREAERQYYEMHQRFRQALQQAQMTGQPAFMMKDRDGKDIYVEPPQYAAPGGAYGGGFGGGYGGGYGGRQSYGGNGYGINPYQSGVYANPNNKFIRPQQQYSRGMGGGGMALPLMGGLMGGLLLGDLLF